MKPINYVKEIRLKIQAMQYDGDNVPDLVDWLSSTPAYQSEAIQVSRRPDGSIIICVIGNNWLMYKGDYLIQGNSNYGFNLFRVVKEKEFDYQLDTTPWKS